MAEAAAAYQTRVEERLRRAEVERVRAEVRSCGRTAGGGGSARDWPGGVRGANRVGRRCGGSLGRKNSELTAANGQLDAARAEAEAKGQQAGRARDRTFQALDAMTSSVTGESLETQAAISPEQETISRRGSELLRGVRARARRRRRNPQASRVRRDRVGLIHSRLGNHETGVRAFERAADVYRKLATDFHPHASTGSISPEARTTSGRSSAIWGGRSRGRRRSAAGLRCEKLTVDFPASPKYREDLAGSYNNLGVLLRDAGKPREAEGPFRKARRTAGEARRRVPRCTPVPPRVGQKSPQHGDSVDRTGGRPGAGVTPALTLREKLVAEHPAAHYRHDLASSHHHLGLMFRNAGKRPEAEAAFREALSLREKLVEEFPVVPQYRRDLAGTHHSLGVLLQVSGKRAEAGAAYRAGNHSGSG